MKFYAYHHNSGKIIPLRDEAIAARVAKFERIYLVFAEDDFDYKKLLKKYIQHVGECEGTTFIEDFGSSVVWDEGELAHLRALAGKGEIG